MTNLEISKHAIRCHIIEEEKVEEKGQKGHAQYIYFVHMFQQIGTLSLTIFLKTYILSNAPLSELF